uniref:Secreted protein n=1 Tax=Glossina palpalis gambiensis TaxID=67801 RepID=A0A1B0C2T5_9MUSC
MATRYQQFLYKLLIMMMITFVHLNSLGDEIHLKMFCLVRLVVDGNAVQPPLGWNGSIKRVSRSQVASNDRSSGSPFFHLFRDG